MHPAGKPEKLRDAHLYGLTLPMLFLQGTRDTLAVPELLTAVVEKIGSTAVLQWVEGADHSFNVPGPKHSPGDVGAALAGPVLAFLRSH